MKKFLAFFSYFCVLWMLPTWIVIAKASQWTIAIDPGHGGKDPGAISRHLKLYEKHVTLSVARELKVLLDKDPNFRAVLTRNGDYFISVPNRSEIARKHKANLLVSIHADSSESPLLRGASVWVLSNRRANSEMGRWLEDHEKHSELLGGAGAVLSSSNEKYLDQTVLDLQFGHSQRVGYELGTIVLRRFATITTLSRNSPQHASLGVLRSPDIPSILVETGFLSNVDEERKLNSLAYRKQLARIIYQSLVEYRYLNVKSEHSTMVKNDKQLNKNNAKNVSLQDSGIRHKVKAGDSLGKLAAKYHVRVEDLIALNKLKKRRELLVGETLKIPQNAQQNSTLDSVIKMIDEKEAKSGQLGAKKNNQDKAKKVTDEKNKGKVAEKTTENIPKYHQVRKNQTLFAISREYKIPVDELLKLNPKLKEGKVQTGQRIKLRE